MISSTFNTDLNILETKFKGVITNNDIINYLSSFNKKNYYPKILKIIVDTTNASAKLSFPEINGFNIEKVSVHRSTCCSFSNFLGFL